MCTIVLVHHRDINTGSNNTRTMYMFVVRFSPIRGSSFYSKKTFFHSGNLTVIIIVSNFKVFKYNVHACTCIYVCRKKELVDTSCMRMPFPFQIRDTVVSSVS